MKGLQKAALEFRKASQKLKRLSDEQEAMQIRAHALDELRNRAYAEVEMAKRDLLRVAAGA